MTTRGATCRPPLTRFWRRPQIIDKKIPRGALFTSPELVKDYLRTKLAGFEHEVFTVLFLDTRPRLIEYLEMFRGTIDSTSVYPREVVKEALRVNAAAVILALPITFYPGDTVSFAERGLI